MFDLPGFPIQENKPTPPAAEPVQTSRRRIKAELVDNGVSHRNTMTRTSSAAVVLAVLGGLGGYVLFLQNMHTAFVSALVLSLILLYL